MVTVVKMMRKMIKVFCFSWLLFSLVGCSLPNNRDLDNNIQNAGSNDNIANDVDVNIFLNIINDELSMYLKYDSVDDIGNYDKLEFIFNKYVSDYGRKFDLKEFPALNLQKYFTDSSIIDFGYKNENIYCNGYYNDEEHILWFYDKLADKYVLNEEHSKHVEIDYNDYVLANKVVEYKSSNNRYTVGLNYLFGSVSDGSLNSIDLYGSYSSFKNSEDIVTTINRDSDGISYESLVSNYLNNNYDNIKDKLASYEYTFTYINNKIKLVDFNVN